MDESNCVILQNSVPAPEEQNAEHRTKSKHIVTHTLVGALSFLPTSGTESRHSGCLETKINKRSLVTVLGAMESICCLS